MEAVYDICIVGAGMIGSAAARHASVNRSTKVCLIGPDEPVGRKVLTGNEVFGAYYDEGRITRGTDSRPVWAVLAQRSIQRYRQLEEESGISFYHEVGEMVIGTKGQKYISVVTENAKRTGLLSKLQKHDGVSLRENFPAMQFSTDDVTLYNAKDSGYINPRRMVEAQITVAKSQGCVLKRDVVLDIQKRGNFGYFLKTESGENVIARKVLLATNVFTSMHKLLGGRQLVFTPMPQTVTLVEVSAEDAEALRYLPTVLYTGHGGTTWPTTYPRNPDGNIHFYMLPPIRYPDGKFYIKLGHSDAILKRPLRREEIQDWYCGRGDRELEQHMFELVQGIFPNVNFLSHHGDACVTMATPSYHPYIDLISPTFGVVVGGNGWAAKSSDEIGRVAAEMIVHSEWTYDIPWETFKVRLAKPTGIPSKL